MVTTICYLGELEAVMILCYNCFAGWLTVAKPLPRHQEQIFTVRVRATDQGVPPKTADALVSLAITTKNKFSPVFTALGYQIIIPENEPVHSELLTVSATDADSGKSKCTSLYR